MQFTIKWTCEACGAEMEAVLDTADMPSIHPARCPGCGCFSEVAWPDLEALRRFVVDRRGETGAE